MELTSLSLGLHARCWEHNEAQIVGVVHWFEVASVYSWALDKQYSVIGRRALEAFSVQVRTPEAQGD